MAFSDHLALNVKIEIPDSISRYCTPRSRPVFKIKEEVVRDREFQERVVQWKGIRDEGLPVLTWWEIVVKPGIRKIAINGSKEINQDRKKAQLAAIEYVLVTIEDCNSHRSCTNSSARKIYPP